MTSRYKLWPRLLWGNLLFLICCGICPLLFLLSPEQNYIYLKSIIQIRNFAKVANKWQNIPKVQNRGEGRGSTIFSPFCILMLRERFGMLRCLVNTFFYLRPKYLLHKNSGIVVLYANINSPRVKDCVFFCLVAVESINLEFA